MRKIKKYSNHKLYDTTTSSYINLEELLQLIKDGETVEVTDDTTGDVITNNLLLQSILENNSTVKMFPTPLLHRLIRLQEKENFQSTIESQIAHGLQLLDAQLAKLEGGNWNTFIKWGSFSTEKDSNDGTEEPSENRGAADKDRGENDGQPKSVVDQQLDTIRSHISSLEARLRKKK
jgi:polyhydroxyalkanoate synthesis repressor PhaR